MEQYLELYRAIGIPQFAVELAAGHHESDWCEPIRWGGFPPAFLPLFEHWNADFGYWKHWFTPQRQMTIVQHQGVARLEHVLSISEMLSGPHPARRNELLVTEVACDLEQLVRIRVLDWLCNGAGDWDDTIRDFAAQAGLSTDDISFIDTVASDEYRPVAFRGHPLFTARTPLSCFEDDLEEYTGDFPNPKMQLSRDSLARTCTYEIHSSYMYDTVDSDELDIRDQIGEMDIAPPWFTTQDQLAVCDELLDAGNMSGAWMSLNSFAWVCSDAVSALERLAAVAKDSQFDMLVKAYSSLDHEEQDGY